MTTLKDDHLQCNGVLKGVNIFEVRQIMYVITEIIIEMVRMSCCAYLV